jgi:hypothetical protein
MTASPIKAHNPLCGLYGIAKERHRIFTGCGDSLADVWIHPAIAMRSTAEPGVRGDMPESDSPGLDLAYEIAEVVMEVEGPLFWAILLVALVVGPFGIRPFG